MSLTDTREIQSSETTKETESQLDQLYEFYKSEEAKSADPEELIKVGDISPDNPEYQLLTQKGVSPEEITSGRIQRRKLLSAGFIFNNVLGNGEKPIIMATIDDIDFGKRKLITKEELEKIRQYQLQNLISPNLQDIDKLRRDMLSFIQGSPDPRPLSYRSPVNVYRLAMHGITNADHIFRERITDSKLRTLYQQLITRQKEIWEKRWREKSPNPERFNVFYAQKDFMEEKFHDLFPWKEEEKWETQARGHKTQIVESRYNSLKDSPSPFLDSGFHFPSSPDITINTNQGVMRINMAVFHLASRGISEMGNGNGKSFDQHYMAINEFAHILFKTNPAERSKTQETEATRLNLSLNFDGNQLIANIQDRIIELSLQEASNSMAPENMQKLAKQVRERQTRTSNPNQGRLLRRFFRR